MISLRRVRSGLPNQLGVRTLKKVRSAPLLIRRLLFLGDRGVGKTTMIQKLAGEKPSYQYNPTVGSEHITLGGQEVIVELIDCSDVQAVRHSLMAKKIDAVFVVYATDERKTFNIAEDLCDLVRQLDSNVAVAFVGNKADSTIEVFTGKEYALEHEFFFFETSAVHDRTLECKVVWFLEAIPNLVGIWARAHNQRKVCQYS